jgi:hypothetical protein
VIESVRIQGSIVEVGNVFGAVSKESALSAIDLARLQRVSVGLSLLT